MSVEEKCVKKTNLLVYQQPSGEKQKRTHPCSEEIRPKYKPTICRLKPKVIRVCTGAELKRMCPPKHCECAPKVRRPSRGVFGIFGFGLKAALAAAAIYVTYDLGIWGSMEDTQNLYRTYCTMTKEPAKKKMGKWDPPSCEAERDLLRIPSFKPYGQCDDPPFDHERSAYNFQNTWNCAIECIFAGIVRFPYNIIDKFQGKETTKVVEEEQQLCIPFDELSDDEKIINKYK
ncbi:uncharacterized protein [Leptinotarsa decemlineata]|uniref:uncharacterized protein n=1 Tax=Leptinotarsa decemlineata TaxID=7539 RepID=UPI003D3063DF